MGETNKGHAEMTRGLYRQVYEEILTGVRKNFEDMDFENADKRADMEKLVQDIEDRCHAQMNTLDAMEFE